MSETMKKRLREYRKLIVTLFAITAAAALLLSVVNAVTVDPIARHTEERRTAAMAAVAPNADAFSQVRFDRSAVLDMYAAYHGEKLQGYCVELDTDGFAGPIRLIVGVSAAGAVTGVSMLDHNETAGLGANAADAEFLDQFLGRSGSVAVGRGALDAVSGATVTSKAVARGVSAALEAVADYQAGGGENHEEGEV